ncbi:MAG: twin-arginine translocase TatA/TatE family subunit [Chloroherpetonaceae bacterium]|nr:twin-arginine translocase TatA/TatE family subunit [Chloroherpetonaceae bacterium]MDW8437658.1 twin-arginine translocase TatA/TatE family subunit [Chloroherpetonaceae bacterium]
MFGLGFQELIIIFFIILLLFGAKKLPELARGLGKGINEFKRAQQGLEEEIKNAASDKPTDKELAEKISKMSDEEKAKLAELLGKK